MIADNIFAALAIKPGYVDSATREIRDRELNKPNNMPGFFNANDYKKTMP